MTPVSQIIIETLVRSVANLFVRYIARKILHAYRKAKRRANQQPE